MRAPRDSLNASPTLGLADAVAALARGALVGFPTETVYGLGADAGNKAAIARLYAAKGRPASHPVIVHVASAEALGHWARNIPHAAARLAEACWPGPLTLVLQRAPHVLDAVTGGQHTVAVRCPDHPLALALLEACARAGIAGLVAPSANRFGRVSPTTAAHVREEFGEEIAGVLDGGACAIGIESTIVDVSTGAPRILRPGMLTEARIAEALGAALGTVAAPAPRVSGAMASHYAPRTPVNLADAASLAELTAAGHVVVLAFPATLASLPARAGLLRHAAPETASDYARTLYATLRELDALGCARIVVERPPQTDAWRGINDRLQRAAAEPAS